VNGAALALAWIVVALAGVLVLAALALCWLERHRARRALARWRMANRSTLTSYGAQLGGGKSETFRGIRTATPPWRINDDGPISYVVDRSVPPGHVYILGNAVRVAPEDEARRRQVVEP
jgi:hypothetical protein